MPLAQDLLSLEYRKSWKQIYDEGDHTSIYHAAQALMTMQHAFGLFPRILGKGDLAQRLASLLLRQKREHITLDPKNPALTHASTTIDSLVIIDRSVDLATPMCSQLTYEGLLDELIGIEAAHVEVPDLNALPISPPASNDLQAPSGSNTPLLPQTPRGGKRKKHHLDPITDRVVAVIRDDNFAVVGMKLHEVAKRLNQDYDTRHTARTVPQMRAFVGRLGGLEQDRANLSIHTGLAQAIMRETGSERFARVLEIEQNLVAGVGLAEQQNAIEELINMEAPLATVVRLMCLLSVVGGGLKPKTLEFFKREILQTYGFEHLPLLLKLAKVGLLAKATPASTRANIGFAGVRRSLKLINDDVDEHRPRDISYVYSGYAPLSVRLVQAIAQKEAFIDPKRRLGATPESALSAPRAHPIIGWRGFEEVIACLPGATVDESQAQPTASASDPDQITTTVVFFLGGITYAEIAAIRYMSRQTRNRRFLIATTQTITGTTLVQDLYP